MKRLFTFLLLSALSFAQVNSARMLSGINAQTGASYTFVAQDSTRVTTFSNASAVAVTLPAGTTANFGAGAVFSAKNIGAGTVTITCSSCTINATGTPAATLQLVIGQGADLYSDGVNYTAMVTGATLNFGPLLPVGLVARTVTVYADGSNNENVVGTGNGIQALGSRGLVGATATESSGISRFSAATASLNSTAGLEFGCGANPGQGQYSIGTSQQQTWRLLLGNSTNVRYWIGTGDCVVGDFGGTSIWATDTPGRAICAFRYSAGTDATIAAVTSTGSSQTVVSTSVAPDLVNSMLFTVLLTSTPSCQFYLNGALVATITTTLPTQALRQGNFWIADNKNTNTAIGATTYSGTYAFTK